MGGSGLTIYRDSWAYCGGDDAATDHEWTEVEGLPVVEARALSRTRGSFESALVAADALHAELQQAVGLTSFRLELARHGAPLAIDIGDAWPTVRRAELELTLADAAGTLGRVLIADARRADYHRLERGIAMQISARYVAVLRRCLPPVRR